MPANHENNVEDVKRDHESRLPDVQFPIYQKYHAKACRENEKSYVTHKTFSGYLERVHQCHTCRNDGCYETSGSEKLSDCKTATVRVHGCERRKDVRATISEGQERHTREALAHAQDACNGIQIYAQKVRSSDANGAEKKTHPYGQYYERDRLHVGKGAVVKLEVGDQACILILAVALDIAALIVCRDRVNKSALQLGQSRYYEPLGRRHTSSSRNCKERVSSWTWRAAPNSRLTDRRQLKAASNDMPNIVK